MGTVDTATTDAITGGTMLARRATVAKEGSDEMSDQSNPGRQGDPEDAEPVRRFDDEPSEAEVEKGAERPGSRTFDEEPAEDEGA